MSAYGISADEIEASFYVSASRPKPRPKPTRWPTKEDCPGCVAKADADGRLQPGFCGPTCLMKKYRDDRIVPRQEP